VQTQAGEDDPLRRAVIAGDIDWLRTRQTDDALRNPIRWSDGGLLTCAVEHNQVEILRMLLDCGFDPDEHIASGEGDWAAHSQGYPLWHAAALGRREMAEILLDYGADPNVHVDSSGSAVYSAYSHNQWEMVELLRSRGGIVTADIAAIYRQTNLARQMLADNADSKAVEELLHFGASGGSSEIVRMALERITWPREDSRWFRVLAQPLSFWHHIPWLYAGNRAFDRDGYLACFRQILARADPNVPVGSDARCCTRWRRWVITWPKKKRRRLRKPCSKRARKQRCATAFCRARRSAGHAVGVVCRFHNCSLRTAPTR
jgi:hypothetical protein